MAVGASYLPHLVSYWGVAKTPSTCLCVATSNVNESQFDFHISFAFLPLPLFLQFSFAFCLDNCCSIHMEMFSFLPLSLSPFPSPSAVCIMKCYGLNSWTKAARQLSFHNSQWCFLPLCLLSSLSVCLSPGRPFASKTTLPWPNVISSL